MMTDTMLPEDQIVFVVDDEELVRWSLKEIFESIGVEVRTFSSAHEFLDAYPQAKERPGCLITDVCMPIMTGLELKKEMNRRSIDLPVIMLTAHGDVKLAVEAMKEGAVDFIEKPQTPDDLIDRTRKAIGLDQKNSRKKNLSQNARHLMSQLTPREREVLEYVVAGEPSKRIAFILGLSKQTIEFHRANIRKKLQVKSLADLVRTVMIARAN